AALGPRERDLSLLITRLLDDLYWVMSYSRWKDERYWPAFRAALMREHSSLTEEGLAKAREFNFQRYHFQGIGRYAPDAAYARGLADLGVLADLVPADGYVHGAEPTSIDAGLYGFIANIYFYDIDTPLKQFVSSRPNLARHCTALLGIAIRGRLEIRFWGFPRGLSCDSSSGCGPSRAVAGWPGSPRRPSATRLT
ncbi:MAG: glutathione S-transferase C-terminal domain-containing protein, partial [Methylocella sp.]